jgi:hypothetical protein
MLHFGGFWCRRCGGRVFFNEIYWELESPSSTNKIKKVELTCTLCAKNSRCTYKEYKHLLSEIARVLREKESSKTHKK